MLENSEYFLNSKVIAEIYHKSDKLVICKYANIDQTILSVQFS